MLRLSIAHDTALTAERTSIYWESLCDLPDADFVRGADECLRTVKFFPRIAEIRESALRRQFTDDLGVPLPDFRNLDEWRDANGHVRPRMSGGRFIWPDDYRADGRVHEYMSGDAVLRVVAL